MNILLVYPAYPDTFWSYRYALKFISRKAGFPPLGLLTVASMLPAHWNMKLADCNVRPLREDEVRWSDFVFLSGMSAQRESVGQILEMCKKHGKPVVAGGPLFTAHPDKYADIDHLVLNEAEITLPEFLGDMETGRVRHMYTTTRWADIRTTPIPSWGLIDSRQYGSMNLQYSRGCPFDCEFCDITTLYGRIPRTKTRVQVLAELDALYNQRWRGGVFFVDDNFIGNKEKLRSDILPAIAGWMEQHRYPFSFNTEATINLADDDELMALMTKAGFDTVFVGIESPNEESLLGCRKIPNKNRDLVASVKKLQRSGLEVQGGFILGFDEDPDSIFDRLIRFVQETNIVTAMVGLLNAPKGTRLYNRLLREGRILSSMSGDNTDCSINFLPAMNLQALLEGYHTVLQQLYSPKEYYRRVKRYLQDYKPVKGRAFRFQSKYLFALIKSMLLLGVIGKERLYYWRLFFWSLLTRPSVFPLAITFSIYGFHFRKVFEQYLRVV